jgi:hypothetical protein
MDDANHPSIDDQAVRQRLREALGTVRPPVTMSREGLVLTALEWGVEQPAAYATAAAREGALALREQGGGTVPAIEAVTKEQPVVIFAGDTVEGGKQNRIINVTVWLAAMKVTSIPVSCLEAGRWNEGYGFRHSHKVGDQASNSSSLSCWERNGPSTPRWAGCRSYGHGWTIPRSRSACRPSCC